MIPGARAISTKIKASCFFEDIFIGKFLTDRKGKVKRRNLFTFRGLKR
jgi:hypothetical protein